MGKKKWSTAISNRIFEKNGSQIFFFSEKIIDLGFKNSKWLKNYLKPKYFLVTYLTHSVRGFRFFLVRDS